MPAATLGALRSDKKFSFRSLQRSVKDELRENLICKLQRREPLFPGIVGYDDTVIPQVVNAVLSRHNFILPGLRAGEDPHHPHAAGGLYGVNIAEVTNARRVGENTASRSLDKEV